MGHAPCEIELNKVYAVQWDAHHDPQWEFIFRLHPASTPFA